MKHFIMFSLYISLSGAMATAQQVQVFEPGVISNEDTWDEYISFAPDGNTLVFTRSGSGTEHRIRKVYMSFKESGKWSEPELASFSSNFEDSRGIFSPDGNTIYFVSKRPIDASSSDKRDQDLWYSVKQPDGSWGAAVWMGEDINTNSDNETHPTITKDGTLFFVRFGATETDIYKSSKSANGYENPVKLGNAINTEGPDSHPFIDPDGRFMIFAPTGREDGLGGGDIYISYYKNGEWTTATNIGAPVNSDYYEYSAKIAFDGNLYFTRAGFGNPERKAADIYFIPLKYILPDLK